MMLKTMIEEYPLCPELQCDRPLSLETENNGFTPPDPTHYDDYFNCSVHGRVNPKTMLSKLLVIRDELKNVRMDLVEVETKGGELNDTLRQISDLALRLEIDVANAMIGNENRDN